MKRTSLSALLALGTLVSGAAMAQPSCGVPPGQELSRAQISTLLSGRHVYGNQYDGKYFNVHHAMGGSGDVTDYKRGPNAPKDKSRVVGSYSVPATPVSGREVVTYTYGSNVYSYSISPKPTGQNAPAPGDYVFCQRAGTGTANVGQALSLTVSDLPGPVQP